jgi:KUP system potassium uptake protein
MASSDTVPETGDTPPQPGSAAATDGADAAAATPHMQPQVAALGVGALALGALGIVFGDIGTSPLYALQTVFAADHGKIPVNRSAVYGVISMMLWTLLIVVTVKYVALVMRADNDGEGGMMALVALIRRLRDRTGMAGFGALVILGVFGASLFFGDAMITPAISVLSAVEGLKVVDSSLGSLVLPIALAVLLALFAAQRFGTGTVGRLFGPIMVVWFGVIALFGAVEIARAPGILQTVSPTWAISFAFNHIVLFFVAITGVVLCITGVEALYGDMGHFGRAAITRAWLWLVFPALILNYMGQGAKVLADPTARSNPFFLLVPHWAQVPMVLLATVATVIASQSVIAGAFSLGHQAAQLGFLPRLTIRHTSHSEVGQVYLPAINTVVLVAVVLLVLGFRSSANLAAAYGVAVTGTILITTILFFTVARARWGLPTWLVVAGGVFFGSVDLVFFGANLTKLFAGGWFPVAVGLGVFWVFMTWNDGRERVTRAREREEGPLMEFIEEVRVAQPPLHRVPGTAVFLNANPHTTPLALRANVEHNHTLHDAVLVVSVEVHNVPVIVRRDRITVDDLGYTDDGIFHVAVHYGFDQAPDIPSALELAAEQGLECPVDLEQASYFVSRIALRRDDHGQNLPHRVQKSLFLTMARQAANPVEYFGLPFDRTVVIGGHVTV